MQIKIDNYNQFEVTGFYAFTETPFPKKIYAGDYAGAQMALSINLWRGEVVGIRKDTGKAEILLYVDNRGHQG